MKTPGFDCVARGDVLFSQAYVPNAKSAPSRACMLTGRNSWQFEKTCNHCTNFPAQYKTCMEALRAHGSHTGYTMKGWVPGNPGTVNGAPRELTGTAWNARARTPPTPHIEMWLVSADVVGAYPCTVAGGEEIERWDAYQQPTGFHYNPYDDYQEPGQPPANCFHHNCVCQDAAWLDFQWCQTGHNGQHLQHKVRRMHGNQPVKAVADGEPTYEGMREADNAADWWQGEEAWLNLTSGGTMGVVYGAVSLCNGNRCRANQAGVDGLTYRAARGARRWRCPAAAIPG